MAEDALPALYKAVNAAFIAAGITGAYPDYVPTYGNQDDYYLYFWLGGGATNRLTRKDDANIVLGIKRVTKNLATAFQGTGLIASIFDNKGVQDVLTGGLNAGPDWAILTSTKGLIIHVVEQMSTSQRYHEGNQYRFVMERIT